MSETHFPGNVLKERREQLGYSVEAAAHEIHISPEHIKAFETGVFSFLPEETYVLGFLRSYCRFLDLESDPFCDQYLICTRSRQNNRRFYFIGRSSRSTSIDQPYSRRVNELINWGSVCAIIIIGWLAYSTIAKPIIESWKTRVDASAIEVEAPVHFNEDL